MSKIGLIIKREYGSRVKKKSFIIMTLLGPILIAAFYASAIYMGIQESGSIQVLLLDETHLANSKDFPTSENFEFATFNGTTVDDLKNELQEKNSIDQIGIYLPGNLIKVNEAKIFFSEPLSANKQAELKETVNDFAEKLKVEKAGFDLKAYSKIQTRMNIAVIDVNTNEESITEIKSTIGFLFSIIIYVFIFMYGVQVMRGVIEEKTSRIIEVMVSSVKPFQLMMGKIVGIALVGLTQFLMWIILSSVFMLFIQGALLPDLFDPAAIASQSQDLMQSQNLMQSQELIDAGENINSTKVNDLLRALINIPWVLLVSLFIFYFLGGYLLYASLFAAVGAAVDSESDTQQFMVPITLPLVFAFVISSMAINNPGGEAIVWFSHVPFTSPIVMLVRVAMGDVAWWEILTSMFILIVSFILTTKLASKIYRIGILMYGKKVTYKELFKWLKYK